MEEPIVEVQIYEAGQFYEAGQSVEVWLAGWNRWISGSIEQVGFLDRFPCVRVFLDGDDEVTIFRQDQLRPLPAQLSLSI